VEVTSDTIPLSLLRHRYIWKDPSEMPGILTESPYYRALWSSNNPGVWVLRIKAQANPESKTELVMRSVGPAGGPVHLLEWNDRQLIINSRWAVTLKPMPLTVQLGEERKNGWMNERSDLKRWSGAGGWGYARLELNPKQEYELVISDLEVASTSDKNFAEPQPTPRLELPDERFGASLRAQIAQLLMGLVSDGTRPGDPMSYPFGWLRDEAYIVVALARSGQLAAAKELAARLAEKDFFGGFGAEADAPGLAIWALTELAKQLNDRSYDQWLWPHVRRKAELILTMLSTDRPIHRQGATPVIPLYTKPLPSPDPDVTLVADPPRDGLIKGRIHSSWAPLYVSAASYRGLIDAASLADRVDQPAWSREWRKRAVELKRAWSTIFERTEQKDALTYARGLWPTLAASSSAGTFSRALESQWEQYPANNYWQHARENVFRMAQAHEWLWLGRADRAWATLAAFWDHQETPGLYAWCTESNRENSFNRWKNVRGWLNGQDGQNGEDIVTPSYRTAAEMLLLQLDMLAYSDETANEPTIVIGAGVQPSWLDHGMRAQGIATAIGRVDWSWDGRRMRASLHGSHARVRLGPAFRADTPLYVKYASP
ncbi:MAG TPA: hypothetical protein VK200_02500, partial [Candidatus Limnocylindrales bacterium]|nr:hypothetical protein [Candidatus Limnocylindrales bacterium]